MPRVTFVRVGTLTIEWDATDNMRIVRESDMQSIALSCSEFNLLVQVAALHSWPVAAPGEGITRGVEA